MGLWLDLQLGSAARSLQPSGVHVGSMQMNPEKEVMLMKQLQLALPIPDGFVLIFRPYRDLKNGKRIYAKTYGYRAFPMVVKAA